MISFSCINCLYVFQGWALYHIYKILLCIHIYIYMEFLTINISFSFFFYPNLQKILYSWPLLTLYLISYCPMLSWPSINCLYISRLSIVLQSTKSLYAYTSISLKCLLQFCYCILECQLSFVHGIFMVQLFSFFSSFFFPYFFMHKFDISSINIDFCSFLIWFCTMRPLVVGIGNWVTWACP